MSQRPPGSFTQATAPALPTSSSTATGKPGRCAASALGPWLRQHYYERTWDAPSPTALNAALNVLEAHLRQHALAAQRPGFPVAVDDEIGKAGDLAPPRDRRSMMFSIASCRLLE